jgi:hypothetical protein
MSNSFYFFGTEGFSAGRDGRYIAKALSEECLLITDSLICLSVLIRGSMLSAQSGFN